MENPVFFTVLAADDDGHALTDAGILGSRNAAETEAARRCDRLPGLRHIPAVITLVDQDPITGTPLPHIPPPNPAGYALASLSVAEPARRHFATSFVFDQVDKARQAADHERARNRKRGTSCVRDVVALTIINPKD